jgi:hypothetical protein
MPPKTSPDPGAQNRPVAQHNGPAADPEFTRSLTADLRALQEEERACLARGRGDNGYDIPERGPGSGRPPIRGSAPPYRSYRAFWTGLSRIDAPGPWSSGSRYTYDGSLTVLLSGVRLTWNDPTDSDVRTGWGDSRPRVPVRAILADSILRLDYQIPLKNPRLFTRSSVRMRLDMELRPGGGSAIDAVSRCARPMQLVVTRWAVSDGDHAEHGSNSGYDPYRQGP